MNFFDFKSILNKEHDDLTGLAVSMQDLIDQQQYVAYLASSKNRFTSNMAGDVKSAFKGRGMEFDEVRAYTDGDDVRYIDWRVTARRNEPFSKVYSEEKDREIIVLLDMSASMVFGTRCELKTVTAAKLAALIGWISLQNKDRFGLLLYDGKNTTYYKPQNNLKMLISLFGTIVNKSREVLQQNYDGDISTALKLFEISHKGQGTFFILSDFHNVDKESFKNIAAISRRHKVYCINIFDTVEETAPASGVYAAQSGLTKTVFDTDNPKFQAQYQQYFAAHRTFLQNSCQKFFCNYLEIRTDKPIFKQLGRI